MLQVTTQLIYTNNSIKKNENFSFLNLDEIYTFKGKE